MKKIIGALLALVTSAALAATTVPVQLLNPTGSSSGQAIVSTGASSAPAWGGIGVNGIASIAANTVLANATGSSASPTAFAMPSCSATGNALNYTSGTGFTCNTALFSSPTITTPNITGVTNASNASAGSVGEYLSSSISSGSAVSLTTATPANVTSITLTAGDWEVSGTIGFTPSSTPTVVAGCVNSTSATICSPAAGALFYFPYTSNTAGAQITSPTGARRFNVSTNTTVYLVAQCNFSGTCSAFGLLQAWRRR